MFETSKNPTAVAEVLSTTDYEQFESIKGNRGVNLRHIDNIKRSMDEKQLMQPAIVNEKYEVIDGQHRLRSCTELGLPFNYIVMPGYTLADVQRVNANMVNWNDQDFLDSFCDLYDSGETEYVEYKKLKEFIQDTGLPLATAVVLANSKQDKGQKEKDFRGGKFAFEDIVATSEFVRKLKEVGAFADGAWKNANFAMVFLEFASFSEYEHHRMIKNLQDGAYYDRSGKNLFELVGSKNSARSALATMYNHRTPRTKKISELDLQNEWLDSVQDYKREMAAKAGHDEE